MTNHNVSSAIRSAQNAVENNCAQLAIPAVLLTEEILVALGLTTSAMLTPMLIEKFNKMYNEYKRNKGEGYECHRLAKI